MSVFKGSLMTLWLSSMVLPLNGCHQVQQTENTMVQPSQTTDSTSDPLVITTPSSSTVVTGATIRDQLEQILQEYYRTSDHLGTLQILEYRTYESFTYEFQEQLLNKRAIVYLPEDYSSDQQYNVLYLMHGGWSDETTYLGTPQ